MMDVECFLNRGMSSNAYLIDKKILIDPGLAKDAMVLEEEIIKRGYKPEEITKIIGTHAHTDHINAVAYFVKKYECKFYLHESDVWMVGDLKKTCADLLGEDAKNLDVDVELKDGDRIEGLQVIHTPGHTEGSICLYADKEGLIFSGDLWFGRDVYGRTDLAGGDPKKLEDSIGKIEKLEIKKIFPGHGNVFEFKII
jgi:glyoxylase-like metal-dependent hydrolase (beta-lactamase superfamily II)